MKKLRLFLSALMLLACGLVLGSCDLKDFEGPTDEWVYKANNDEEYSFVYEYGDSKIKFDVYVNYATKESDFEFEEGGNGKIKKGFNVILIPKFSGDTATSREKSALTELLGSAADELGDEIGNICLFYAFGTEAESVDSDVKDASGDIISLTGTIWGLIYNFNNFEDVSNKELTGIKEHTLFTSEGLNLNWKKVLYNIIGNAILD